MVEDKSSRCNNANSASVPRDVIGEGSFKVVYKGTYNKGQRTGEACAAKEMRSGPTWLNSVFDNEMEVVARAVEIINQFNTTAHIDKPILMNRPEVWQWDDDAANRAANRVGAKNLVEPFIENFEKFNSNTGWTPAQQKGWTQVMQALSHFSYHCSSGQFVLCDLQGGVYSHAVVLTDPVVHSRERCYGATDMGPQGIEQFFNQHKCNGYCNKAWHQPTGTRSYFPVREGTSMVGHNGQWMVPTRATRPPLDPTAPTVRYT